MLSKADVAKPFITVGMLISLALILVACSLLPYADFVPAADNGQESIASFPVASVSYMDIALQKDDMPDYKMEQNTILLLIRFT